MQRPHTISRAAQGIDPGRDATRKLARHAAALRYEMLPPALVRLTRQCILDTLGVTLGASGFAPEARILADYVREQGGRPESTVLGFGGRVPAPLAALVNGSLGHMLDFDDTGGGHVSIATVPVAFAVAERLGGVTGQELITAIAAGVDVMTRLELSITIPDWTAAEGWFNTQLFGFIAGAATAGRLLGLDPAQMENAFGIAFNQLSGSRQMAVGAATHMRSMQAGFSGQGAILAADLARRGIIGSKDALEGRYGLYKTYVRDAGPDWEALLGGLGTRFPILDTHGFKVWPACAHTRPVNAAILDLRAEGVRPEHVETIVVCGGTGNTRLLSEPIGQKRRPTISIDAKYSVPFTGAIAMVKGTVALRDYTDEGLRDPAVLAMADRISYRPLPAAENTSEMPIVEIRTKDGALHTRQVQGVPGDAGSPVGQEYLVAKFRDCLAFSALPIPAGNVDRAIERIDRFEQLADATEVLRLLG